MTMLTEFDNNLESPNLLSKDTGTTTGTADELTSLSPNSCLLSPDSCLHELGKRADAERRKRHGNKTYHPTACYVYNVPHEVKI